MNLQELVEKLTKAEKIEADLIKKYNKLTEETERALNKLNLQLIQIRDSKTIIKKKIRNIETSNKVNSVHAIDAMIGNELNMPSGFFDVQEIPAAKIEEAQKGFQELLNEMADVFKQSGMMDNPVDSAPRESNEAVEPEYAEGSFQTIVEPRTVLDVFLREHGFIIYTAGVKYIVRISPTGVMTNMDTEIINEKSEFKTVDNDKFIDEFMKNYSIAVDDTSLAQEYEEIKASNSEKPSGAKCYCTNCVNRRLEEAKAEEAKKATQKPDCKGNIFSAIINPNEILFLIQQGIELDLNGTMVTPARIIINKATKEIFLEQVNLTADLFKREETSMQPLLEEIQELVFLEERTNPNFLVDEYWRQFPQYAPKAEPEVDEETANEIEKAKGLNQKLASMIEIVKKHPKVPLKDMPKEDQERVKAFAIQFLEGIGIRK